MKKTILIALLALGAMLPAAAQKFALVDMEYILKNIPAYERANEQLNQTSKKWQAEVEALNQRHRHSTRTIRTKWCSSPQSRRKHAKKTS